MRNPIPPSEAPSRHASNLIKPRGHAVVSSRARCNTRLSYVQRFRLDPLRDPRDVVSKGTAEVEVRQAAFWFFYWWMAWWTERELWVCDIGGWVEWSGEGGWSWRLADFLVNGRICRVNGARFMRGRVFRGDISVISVSRCRVKERISRICFSLVLSFDFAKLSLINSEPNSCWKVSPSKNTSREPFNYKQTRKKIFVVENLLARCYSSNKQHPSSSSNPSS